MIIEVKKLLNQSLHVARSIPMGGECRPAEGASYARPVQVDFDLILKDRDVKLAGRFSTQLLLTCHRCLARFEMPLELKLDLVFIPRDHMPHEVDVELAGEDMIIASYLDVIDLAQVIDEQVALALPMKFLCDKDCKGICSTCGKARNEDPCGCDERRPDERLLVLQEIKEKMFGGGGGEDPSRP